MQITYHFLDEDVSIEAAEQWAALLIDLDRQEYNNNQKERRRHTTLNDRGEDGPWLAYETDFAEALVQADTSERVRRAMRELRPQQQRLLYALYLSPHPVSQAEYARQLGIREESVQQNARRAKIALKKAMEKV